MLFYLRDSQVPVNIQMLFKRNKSWHWVVLIIQIADDVSGFEERFDEEINDKKNGFGFSATDIRQPFVSWLNYNIDKGKGTGVNIKNIMCQNKYKLVGL